MKKITLKIHDLYSPDIDIYSWEPEKPEIVRFLLELEIGEGRDERRDLFQVVIATPEGLRFNATAMVIAERATIVISSYSWVNVKRVIESIVSRCEAPTWEEAVINLQRYFRWEYEDYKHEK